VGCEPVEYTDVYTPSKYGIILKEKVFISPTEATATYMNIHLMKDGQDLAALGIKRGFKLEILDNGKVIQTKEGTN